MKIKTLTLLVVSLALVFALPACNKKDADTKKKDEHTDHQH
jgi:outer membrane protein assembly factor BamE (lipoprotein component of BamABCDE complex)